MSGENQKNNKIKLSLTLDAHFLAELDDEIMVRLSKKKKANRSLIVNEALEAYFLAKRQYKLAFLPKEEGNL